MELAIIPARAGSKGIPNKNIRQLTPDGPNLTELAMHCAREAGIAHRVVTTDIWPFLFSAVKIQRVLPDEPPLIWREPFISSTKWLKRPSELAQDDTPMIEVVKHVLDCTPGAPDDIIVLLQPTQPFREPRHVRAAIDLLRETQADSVVSVVELPASHHAYWQAEIRADKVYALWHEWAECPERRQDLEPRFIRDGTVYAFWRKTVNQYATIYGQDVRPLIIPAEESCELDTEADWAAVSARWDRRQVESRG